MAIDRVTINQSFTGRRFQNVIHLHNPDGLISVEQIAEEVKVNWIGIIRGHQAHALVYDSVTIQRVSDLNPPAPATIPYVNVDGDGTNTLHHASICMLLSFRTALAGRRNRGRYYIATMPWAYTTADVLNSNGTASLQVIVDALNPYWKFGGTGPLNLVIWHRSDRTFTGVSQILFSPRVGIQRRRNVGVGI